MRCKKALIHQTYPHSPTAPNNNNNIHRLLHCLPRWREMAISESEIAPPTSDEGGDVIPMTHSPKSMQKTAYQSPTISPSSDPLPTTPFGQPIVAYNLKVVCDI